MSVSTNPVITQTPEEQYEAHRATLPASNGALPWKDAGWALRAWWEAYARDDGSVGMPHLAQST